MTAMLVLELVASSWGGGAAHLCDLALGIDRTRFAVQVAMPEDGGHVHGEDFEAVGIPFHAVNIANGFSPNALRHIRQLLARVDILHVHGARGAFFGRLAAASLGQRRPRVVYTIHGFAAPHYPHPRRGLLLTMERTLAAITDGFIAVCQAEREALLAAGVAQPDRVRVIRNGINIERFRYPDRDRITPRTSLGIPTDALVVTTVSRLYRPRDFATLLHAFRKVVEASPAAQLLIVGNGPYRPQLEARIRQLDLSSKVVLAGNRRDIPQILAASDIFVLSTARWEGLPLTVLEAMAAGLPVVASDVGGIREAIIDAKTGSIVPPQVSWALSEALLRLLNNQEKARAMGHRGRARVEQHFTLARMVQDIMAVYEDVLNP